MKPMLAYTIEDFTKISYPCIVSVKLDGIRALVVDGVVYSRSMKPIRSKVVQEMFGKEEYNGLDGELLYGDFCADNVFNLTTQAVMSENLKPEFSKQQISYAVFDYTQSAGAYEDRLCIAQSIVAKANNEQLLLADYMIVANEEELLAYETVALEKGYEGIMQKSLSGTYKQGRSTAKEGLVGKLKRFSDDEAIITGFEEKMHNTNEAKTNEVGRSQRSQAQEGMVGAGVLGALVCECKGIVFNCGSGFSDAEREYIWNNREECLGKIAKFKYFAVGMVDSYRFPIWLGFRDADDF